MSSLPAVEAAGWTSRLRTWSLENLARPRAAQEFVPQIDGLRFVAIMGVIFYHLHGFVKAKSGADLGGYAGLLLRLAGEGSFGVPLFFSISGYILCRPFLGGRSVSLKRYYMRRLSRLEPPYMINLLLIFALQVTVLGVSAGALAPHLAASCFYLHNLVYGELSLVNGVTWSLEVEWQFYLLAPLAFYIVARSRPGWRHVGLLATILLGGWVFNAVDNSYPRLQLSLLDYFGFFFAGMWVASLDEYQPDFGRGSFAFDLLGAAAWCALGAVLLGDSRFGFLLPALTALVLLTGIRGRLSALLLGWWPIYCVGAMCYTIYLYHFFVISFVGRVVTTLGLWPASSQGAFLSFALVAVPAVVLVCMVPYLYIERPFMIWRPGKNRLSDAFRRPNRLAGVVSTAENA
jgi:peptidoglycan/LPS O-acetylase OafA/YrhL